VTAIPFDETYFADPHAAYDRMRECAPVHRVRVPDGSFVWLVTREPDVRAGLSDPRLSVDKAHSRDGYAGFSLPPALDRNLLNIDAADHARLRRLVSGAFTGRRAEDMRERIQAVADELVDAMTARGRADLLADFATPLPLTVIGDLFDVPAAGRWDFVTWTNGMLTPTRPGQVAESAGSIYRFLVDLVATRRAEPGDDLLSTLITARDAGDRLSEDELVSLAFLLLWAGIENVQHTIANGMLTLLGHPDQLAALRADPGLLPAAVEELLRHSHPNVVSIRRFAVTDIEIGGTRVPAGDTVMFALASANRDGTRIEDPARFTIRRRDNPHLAFGHGPHYCVAAALARMQLGVAVGTLVRRCPELALGVPAGELRWRQSFRAWGVEELPVVLAGQSGSDTSTAG
jgi:cytochrome P450